MRLSLYPDNKSVEVDIETARVATQFDHRAGILKKYYSVFFFFGNAQQSAWARKWILCEEHLGYTYSVRTSPDIV